MSGFSNNQIERSRGEFEPCWNEIIAAEQSGALLLPAAVLQQYSNVNGWESYVVATGRDYTEDVFNLAANDGHREQMTDSIVRGVQGMSHVVWRTQEVCKSASTLADDSIAVLEQQLAIAREAKEKVNGVSATLLDMEKLCHPELQPMAEDEEDLQLLQNASAHEIIDWIFDNRLEWEEQGILPVWHLLEKRIWENPQEAREVNEGGDLPIHSVFRASPYQEVPLSVVQLLIDTHPEGLRTQEQGGHIPLNFAVEHPDIECFRAVLYGGNKEATIMQNGGGNTPLHRSACPGIGLARMWELLCYNCECISIQDRNHETALQRIENSSEPNIRQHAKKVLLKMVTNYNHVPQVPSDEMIAVVESHPVCTVLAPRLEPGNDAYLLHHALAAHCPLVLIEALVQIFPNQVQQEYTAGRLPLHIALQHGLGASVRVLASAYPAAMFVSDPVTGRLPIQQAVLNVRIDASLDNVDAVNALLRANPAFLE